VNRPGAQAELTQQASIMRVVEVLPFVPATWIIGAEVSGEPSRSSSMRMRSRLGSILCSGARPMMARSTSATRSVTDRSVTSRV
jgi:hypothetical protein